MKTEIKKTYAELRYEYLIQSVNDKIELLKAKVKKHQKIQFN